MGIELGTLALITAAVGAVGGTAASVVAGNQQRAAARHANDLNEQARQEQRAQNYESAAEERRQQIRQERVRAARVEQAAVNTGTNGSSGELGALGTLSTNLSNNLGYNAGAFERGQTISTLRQDAANSIFDGQQRASTTSNIGSIFETVGGLGGAYYSNTAKGKVQPGKAGYDTSFDNPNDYG